MLKEQNLETSDKKTKIYIIKLQNANSKVIAKFYLLTFSFLILIFR